MNQNKPKAYSYIRFSSVEQSKGASYTRQREGCEAYCLSNNLDLVTDDEYTFFDKGVSAFKAQHVEGEGNLKRFLDKVKDGSIEQGSYLVVESLDRLSREDVMDALPRFLDLLKAGIHVVTLADQKVYHPGTVNMMEIMYSILIMARAHEESSIKAARLGDAWQRKKELARSERRPTGANCPMWLKYSKEDGYVIIPDRVAILHKIFSLSNDGYGRSKIAKILNEEGLPSFKNKHWGGSSVDKILNNRAVMGEYQPYSIVGKVKREPAGEPIQGYFPMVIDESTFYSAKAAVDGRRISKATNQSETCNVWQGVAVCAACGSAMHLVNKGRPPKGSRYLQCYSSKKGICKNKPIRLGRSEEVFKEILTKVDSLALVQSNSIKIRRDLNIAEGKIVEQKARLTEYTSLMRGNPSNALAGLMAACEEEIKVLNTEIETLNKALEVDRIVDKADFLSRLDLETYPGRNLANSLLKRLKIKVRIEAAKEGTDSATYLPSGKEEYFLENAFTHNQIVFYAVFQADAWLSVITDVKGLLVNMPFTRDQLNRSSDQSDGLLMNLFRNSA